MPQILCPDCGIKRETKLPSNHTLVSWKKAFGETPAPFTCTQANIYNECVEKKATEKLAAELKQRRDDYNNSRNLREVFLWRL